MNLAGEDSVLPEIELENYHEHTGVRMVSVAEAVRGMVCVPMIPPMYGIEI